MRTVSTTARNEWTSPAAARSAPVMAGEGVPSVDRSPARDRESPPPPPPPPVVRKEEASDAARDAARDETRLWERSEAERAPSDLWSRRSSGHRATKDDVDERNVRDGLGGALLSLSRSRSRSSSRSRSLFLLFFFSRPPSPESKTWWMALRMRDLTLDVVAGGGGCGAVPWR